MDVSKQRTRADQTRARLMEVAVAAFAEKGFHGTTTRDIAAAAGLSPAAVYVHHKSKEELLYRILSYGVRRVLDVVRSTIASESAPAAQLAAVMRAFAEDHARVGPRARIANYELSALNEEHYAEIRALRRSVHAEFRGVVERGVAAGVFDTRDPDMVATALLSLNVDIARWYRKSGRWSPEDVADFYADLAMRIVGSAGPSTLGASTTAAPMDGASGRVVAAAGAGLV